MDCFPLSLDLKYESLSHTGEIVAFTATGWYKQFVGKLLHAYYFAAEENKQATEEFYPSATGCSKQWEIVINSFGINV